MLGSEMLGAQRDGRVQPARAQEQQAQGAQPAGQMAKGWAGLAGPQAPRPLSPGLWRRLCRPHRRNFPFRGCPLVLPRPSLRRLAGLAALGHLSLLPLPSPCPTNSPEPPGRDRPCCARPGLRAWPFCFLQPAQALLTIAVPCSQPLAPCNPGLKDLLSPGPAEPLALPALSGAQGCSKGLGVLLLTP